MGIAYNTSIVSDGLVFALDAANSRSYVGSGLTAYSLVNTFNLSLNNGVGITSSNAGMFVFDGTNDSITSTDYNIPYNNDGEFTIETVCKFNSNPNSSTNLSLKAIVSGKLCPVSTCNRGNGIFAGKNAFCAKRTNVIESFPPEKSKTGLSNCEITSLKMYIASLSKAFVFNTELIIFSLRV